MSMTVPNGSITATKIADAEIVKSLNGLKDNINLNCRYKCNHNTKWE